MPHTITCPFRQNLKPFSDTNFFFSNVKFLDAILRFFSYLCTANCDSKIAYYV